MSQHMSKYLSQATWKGNYIKTTTAQDAAFRANAQSSQCLKKCEYTKKIRNHFTCLRNARRMCSRGHIQQLPQSSHYPTMLHVHHHQTCSKEVYSLELNNYRPEALRLTIIKCIEWVDFSHIKNQLPSTLDPLQFVHHTNHTHTPPAWPCHIWNTTTPMWECCSIIIIPSFWSANWTCSDWTPPPATGSWTSLLEDPRESR